MKQKKEFFEGLLDEGLSFKEINKLVKAKEEQEKKGFLDEMLAEILETYEEEIVEMIFEDEDDDFEAYNEKNEIMSSLWKEAIEKLKEVM